jgi:hypothetical protein
MNSAGRPPLGRRMPRRSRGRNGRRPAARRGAQRRGELRAGDGRGSGHGNVASMGIGPALAVGSGRAALIRRPYRRYFQMPRTGSPGTIVRGGSLRRPYYSAVLFAQ